MKRSILMIAALVSMAGCAKQKTGVNDLIESLYFEQIVIFGVDGAGGAFKDIDTPNFDRVFSNGSITYEGIAESPTISAQNWGSMVYGVGCDIHQKTNGYIAENKHTDPTLPSFMKTYNETNPHSSMYSVVNWSPINYGLFEDLPLLKKDDIEERSGLTSQQIDEKVAEHAIIRSGLFSDAITFLHFDSVDAAGHSYGNASSQYREAIQYIDKLIGGVYDAYASKKIAEKTLFICVSDHGHTESGGHGGESASEKAVTFAINGGTNKIKKGTCGEYHVYDLASVVLHALGVEQPSHYVGSVPENVFNF